MGYTVLYIAFGVVALWLLAEVLLQHKARLRWRLLTFVGFLGVATGVMSSLVVLTVIGAIAFGTGQTFVTLSHRRGFSTGWALGGKPSNSRRRRGAPAAPHEDAAAPDEPSGTAPGEPSYDTAYGASYDGTESADDLAATATFDGFDGFDAFGTQDTAAGPYDGAYGGYGAEQGYGYDGAAPDDPAPVYSPTPLPEDTGEYGVYPDREGYGADPYAPAAAQEGYGAEWTAAPADDVFANGDPSYGGGQAYDPSYAPYGTDPYGQGGYGADPYQQQPAYGQGDFSGYDPAGAPQQGDYAQTAYQQPQYGTGGYPQDPYQQQPYGYDTTPADATWPPQDPYAAQPNPDDPAQQPYQGYGY